jgi:hypothetical protein
MAIQFTGSDAKMVDLVLLLLGVLGISVLPFVLHPLPRRRALRWVVLPGLALLCVAGLVCGGVRWYQTRGSVHQTHTVDEYRFELTSERDPGWERAESYVRDEVFIAIYKNGERIQEPKWFGYIIDPRGTITFRAQRLPNESLIILTPTGLATVVFAFDTATGECFPWSPDAEDQKAYTKRKKAWGTRLRACPGFERYQFDALVCGLSCTISKASSP